MIEENNVHCCIFLPEPLVAMGFDRYNRESELVLYFVPIVPLKTHCTSSTLLYLVFLWVFFITLYCMLLMLLRLLLPSSRNASSSSFRGTLNMTYFFSAVDVIPSFIVCFLCFTIYIYYIIYIYKPPRTKTQNCYGFGWNPKNVV